MMSKDYNQFLKYSMFENLLFHFLFYFVDLIINFKHLQVNVILDDLHCFIWLLILIISIFTHNSQINWFMHYLKDLLSIDKILVHISMILIKINPLILFLLSMRLHSDLIIQIIIQLFY